MRPLRCHKCGSDDLSLMEVCHEIGTWGGLLVDDWGTIFATGDAAFQPGEVQPQLTEITCGGCGHIWHPRRTFAGPFA